MPPEDDILKQVEEHLKEINYNPGWFLGFKAKRLEKQSALIGAQVGKIRNFILAKQSLQKLQREVEEREKLHDISFQTQVQTAITLAEAEKVRRQLLIAASELGMTTEDYSEVQKQKALVDVGVDQARKMTKVETDKHEDMKEIDHKFFLKEIEARIKGALTLLQLPVAQARFILDELINAKAELHQLYFSGKPIQLIEAQAKDYTRFIEGMEVKLGRLLQADNGEDAGGGDTDTLRRGLLAPITGEDEK